MEALQEKLTLSEMRAAQPVPYLVVLHRTTVADKKAYKYPYLLKGLDRVYPAP